ncbi:MAG: heat-inducible transcriptional repressor HrcA [Pseudomonadota bacterium]
MKRTSALARNSEQAELSPRAQKLLRVLIERYVKDGTPVGSRTLARDGGLELSPATIRNVMSDLEELGLVAAPHTSAGRVPTPLGYRVFVDSLMRVRPLTTRAVRELEAQLASENSDTASLVSSASSILSQFTQMAGVVTVPRAEKVTLRQIEFLPLGDQRVLAILVINASEVQNRILQTSREYTRDELTHAANFINSKCAGMELSAIRGVILEELERARASMNQAMIDVVSIAQTALDAGKPAEAEYIMAGETNLMGFSELSDVEKLRRLFDAFNQKRDLLDLLDRSIEASGVQIFIGEESGYQILDDCSVVASPYAIDDEVVGVLGVIGPTRMAYDRVIPVVDITAKLLSTILNSRNEPQ